MVDLDALYRTSMHPYTACIHVGGGTDVILETCAAANHPNAEHAHNKNRHYLNIDCHAQLGESKETCG